MLDFLSRKVDCRLLFATHYHPLTTEFAGSPRVQLGHMAATVAGAQEAASGVPCITFLYRLCEGVCPKSYGLQVRAAARSPTQTSSAFFSLFFLLAQGETPSGSGEALAEQHAFLRLGLGSALDGLPVYLLRSKTPFVGVHVHWVQVRNLFLCVLCSSSCAGGASGWNSRECAERC